MSRRFLLPGRQAAPYSPKRSHFSVLMLAFMGILLLSGSLYFLLPRFFAADNKQALVVPTNSDAAAPIPVPSNAVTDPAADAIALHIRNATQNYNAAITNLRQATDTNSSCSG
jgi:hypothetical protein